MRTHATKIMDEYLTADQVKAIITESLQEFSGQIARQLEAQSERIQETVSKFSDNFLDSLVAGEDEAGEDEDDEGDYDEDEESLDDKDDDFDYEDDNKVADPAVIALKRKLDALEKQAADDRNARQAAETKQQQDALRNSAIEALSKTGKVVNPHQLLKLLESEGKIVERDGQYVVEGKDTHGPTYTPVHEAVDTFLATDYAHFAPSRPGTGTGATAAGSTHLTMSGLKYFNPDGTSKGNIGEALSEDRAGYLAELSQVSPQ